MGWGLAPALHVLVAAQGGLPAVPLAAVPALELATGIVRAVSVPLPVVRLYVGFGVVEAIVRVDRVDTEAVVNVVAFLREHYVVGVVVLGVGLRVLLLGGGLVVRDVLTYGVVVLHEGLLQEVGLEVVGDGGERVERQLGQGQRREVLGLGRELHGGRAQRQRALRRQQRQQRRREAILG